MYNEVYWLSQGCQCLVECLDEVCMFWTNWKLIFTNYLMLNSYAGYCFSVLARRPAILILVFCGLPQSLLANSGIVPYIGPWPIPSKSFPIHHSPVILSFNAIQRYIVLSF
jgi:hypothetical protein